MTAPVTDPVFDRYPSPVWIARCQVCPWRSEPAPSIGPAWEAHALHRCSPSSSGPSIDRPPLFTIRPSSTVDTPTPAPATPTTATAGPSRVALYVTLLLLAAGIGAVLVALFVVSRLVLSHVV